MSRPTDYPHLPFAGLRHLVGGGRLRLGVVGACAFVLAIALGWTVQEWRTWPDVGALSTRNPETTAFIERYRARERAAGRNGEVQWRWVPWERISVHLKRAAVAAEDMEFFFHSGFSTHEIAAAIREAVREREAVRGASTITQQLAKNLWLSPSRNPLRKLREVLLTRSLERHLTKRRILELYLNLVEFGPGVYGAEAAARHYFDKPAARLGEHEAAMLAAGLPRPSRWHPGAASEAYARYVAEIERRMERAEFLWQYVGQPPPPETGIVPSIPEPLVLPDSIPASLSDTGAEADSGRGG